MKDIITYYAFCAAIAAWTIAVPRFSPALADKPLALALVLTLAGWAAIWLAAAELKRQRVKQAKALQEETSST